MVSVWMLRHAEPTSKEAPKQEKKERKALLTFSEDVYDLTIFLDRKSSRNINLENRLDMTSVSSNFSTNIEDLIPPGVVGRYKPVQHIFPNKALTPRKMVNARGDLLVLSKTKRESFMFTFKRDKGFVEIPTIINEEMYFYNHLDCSDVEVEDGNAVLLCYNSNQYQNDVSGLKINYQLFIVNLSTNKMVMNESFESEKINHPRLKIGAIDNIPDTYFVIIYPQLTKTLKRKRRKFEPKSRMILVKVQREMNPLKATEKFKILNHMLINVENEIEKTNRDCVSMITFSIRENGDITIHYGEVHQRKSTATTPSPKSSSGANSGSKGTSSRPKL